MSPPAQDSFAAIRDAATSAPNFDLDTDAIIHHLSTWQAFCSFTVTGAGHDTINVEFVTLPEDMNAFVRDLYAFCPDLVDQGTGCVREIMETLEETDGELAPEMKKLIEGVDFEDEDYGLEILKRELQRDKRVQLWWD